MKKLLLILLCLPMIGFGQKKEKRKIVDGSRKLHISKGEKRKERLEKNSEKSIKLIMKILIFLI